MMEPPSTFEEGFTWPAFFGALFVAALMVPGSIYMGLLAGQGIGQAAQWVTVILFIEVARRANKTLRKSEIFTLWYLASAALDSQAPRPPRSCSSMNPTRAIRTSITGITPPSSSTT